MKILITGANGSIGSYLSNYLGRGHTIFALGKDKLDITDKECCIQTINSIKPDLVIHTAAMTNIDLCELDETSAYTINTIGSLNIAYPCSLQGIPLIYISCSNVYDGFKTSAFYETDHCSPVNIYGKTKLAGEKLIRTVCSKYFIIRTSWVFGGNNCFVENIINNKDVPIFMCTEDISCPTYIGDLCYAIERIMKSDIYGVYNCTNSGAVKKSLWVRYILNKINVDKEILEIPHNFIPNKANRPKSTILDNSLIKNCFNLELRPWEKALEEYLAIK
jgi:dTDP-4-dehydrorhamnose reductase